MTYVYATFAVLALLACSVPSHASSTHTVDIGGPMDELFIGMGWFGVEGPYPQFGGVWTDRCRWASQGASVKLPVFPGVTNTIEIRCGIGKGEGQVLRCLIDGQKAAELPVEEDLVYSFNVSPDLIKGKSWIELSLETNIPAPRSSGDGRDLRAAVDWIKVSADAPARDFMPEMLKEKFSSFEDVPIDKVPDSWRMRYDPNNTGDSYGIQLFHLMTYDDSAFETVPVSFVPGMRRGDVAWFRTKVVIIDKLDEVRKKLQLPGKGLEDDGERIIWVNGIKVTDDDPDSRAASMLSQGLNIIVVKMMKGPLPRVIGDSIVEQPVYSGVWSRDKVIFKLNLLVLASGSSDTMRLSARLISPSGKTVGEISGEVTRLDNGKTGLDSKAEWQFSEYGEHSLVVEDDKGRSQRFPVHYLGIHFFHWGWYSAGGGTAWNGFKPCSNDYIDQLFSKIGDWNSPHHSITWGGAILDPGTGFHLTPKVNYISRHKRAIKEGRLDFVAAPFPPRNVCTDCGESLLRSMRWSLERYQSQLGVIPTKFVSHDATLTPLLPQIMALCGYDTYVLPENWWGQGRSIPGSRDSYWTNPEGTSIRMLDSWYHGTAPITQAKRAVEQGKPAVLCNEEFACLDATVFLKESDRTSMAAEGIFVNPVNLEEYQRITESFARESIYNGDDALCYKGWTGGAEGEFEFEKTNRLLETRLVALENMAACARWLGIEVDQKPINEMWNQSLRFHECHFHWGNGFPEANQVMRKSIETADTEMKRLAGLMVLKVFAAKDGIAVFNQLGFRRSGLVRFEAPAGIKSITVSGKETFALQPDPENEGSYLASLPDLPSCGLRHYDFSSQPAETAGVKASVEQGNVTLDNGLIKAIITKDGQIASVVDLKTGNEIVSNAHKIHLARPHDKTPQEPLSIENNPLNKNYFASPEAAGDPQIICSGPVMAAVECNLKFSDHPAAAIKARFTLAAGERQIRVKLTADFKERTVVWPKGAPQPHEGTYFPGFFISFPMPENAKPINDMAYCLTENALTSTNHETFMKEPFRNGTFNTLSLAGPNTGEYAVLTRGLPDFFVMRKPESYLGMSLGMGTDQFPYNGTYVHEYAVFVPEPADRKRAGTLAYKAAQSFLVDPVAVSHKPGKGALPFESSFVGATGDSVIIPGIQLEDGELRMRVVHLEKKPVKTKITGLLPLKNAEVVPKANMKDGALELGPQSVREIYVKVDKK